MKITKNQTAAIATTVILLIIVSGIYFLRVGEEKMLKPLPPFQKQILNFEKVKYDSTIQSNWVQDGIFTVDGITIERRNNIQIMYGATLPDTQVYKVVWKQPWEYWLFKVKDEIASEDLLKAKITKASPDYYECFVANASNEKKAISYQLRKLK